MFCNTLLEVVLFILFLGLVRLSPSLSRLAWLGFGLTLGIPMGPGHSSSLHIRGDSSTVSGSGRTGGESNRGNLLPPWVRARIKLMRLNTLWGLNI